MKRPAACLIAVLCLSSCEQLPASAPVDHAGYTIRYSIGMTFLQVHTLRRPFMRGAQLYARTDSLNEYWLGECWSVHGVGTTAETDSVGTWEPIP